MRFDKRVVTGMILALMDATPDKATRAFVRDSIEINNPGDGTTHYAGIAGEMSTHYGGTGARRAVAYLYGMGVELDLWDRVNESNPEAFRKAQAALFRAQNSLGVDHSYSWSLLGRQYTHNNFDSWCKSAGF